MNISLHQFQVFATVARTLSISRAAEELLLSQPAVSMQIKALERALGMQLFDHVGKRMQLTEAGKELEGRANRILGLTAETLEVMADLRGARRGRLRVVATTTVGIYVVPTLLGAYHRRHPEVEVQLEVANWERTCERLFTAQADLAVAGPHPQPDLRDLRIEPFMDDELVVIAAPSHPLAGSEDVTLDELAAEPMLMREAGSGTRAATEKLFADHRVPLRRSMELSRNGAIKQAVQAGLGIAVISRGAISLELAARTLCMLAVEHFPIVRTWNIITRTDLSLSPAAAAFCDEVRSLVRARLHQNGLDGAERSSAFTFE